MADDPNVAGIRGGKANKKAFAPHGTKAAASAIPPKLTLKTSTRLRVPSYAPRWITGGKPVGLYLAKAVRSALRSPFASRSPPRSHHRGLSEGLPCRLLLSVTGLCCLVVVAIICGDGPFVNPLFQKIFTTLKQQTVLRPAPGSGDGAIHHHLFSTFSANPIRSLT